MTPLRRVVAASVVSALVLAGCSGGDDGSTDEDVAGDGFGEVQFEEATIDVVEGDLGSYLVDGAGRTLYVFTADASGSSDCNDACADVWPAFAPNTIDSGDIDEARFAFIDRADGSKQLTLDDHPLYYFSGDSGPGQTNGHGSGGVWFVVGTDGEAIR